MKKLYLLLCVVSTVFTFGQNQNSNWIFGKSNRITFFADPTIDPAFVSTINASSAVMPIIDGSASVSDNLTGNLLFYTNGIKIAKFNGLPNNNITVNPSNVLLKGNIESTQNVIIVPYPAHPGQYFIFTISGQTGQTGSPLIIPKRGVHYSLYDLPTNSLTLNPLIINSLNNGTELLDETYRNESECITSVPHANGVDYWVVTYVKSFETSKPGKFLSFLVNSSGVISTPIVTSFEAQTNAQDFFARSLKVSPDTSKIALTFSNSGGIYLGAFNNCNGNIVMNPTSIDEVSTPSYGYCAIDFSPNSNYLYYAGRNPANGIKRFNFTDSTTSLVYSDNNSMFDSMQLAPDGTIYFGTGGTLAYLLKVISNPNDAVVSIFDLYTLNQKEDGLPQLVHWQTGSGSGGGTEVPTFTQIPPICAGATLLPLPTTSTNGITGTWSGPLSNTETSTYIFTPQGCGNTTTMTIVVNQPVVPTFDQVGPICFGTTLSPLPTTSTNLITGTWSPSDLSNMAVGNHIFNFTPNPGTCSIPTQITIVVQQCVDDCIGAITLTTEPNTSHVYNVSTTIETSGSYEVASGKDITMFAGQHIVLKPGTHIKSGALYLAKIKGCGAIESTIRDKFYFGNFCYNSNSVQTSQFSLYDQITIGGVAANYQDFIIVAPNLPAGVTINQNGTVTIAAGLAVDDYSFLFHVCLVSNVSTCSTDWIASFSVLDQITANDDNIAVIVNPSNVTLCGNSTLDLLVNDTICPSTLATPSNVDISLLDDSDYFSLSNGTLVIDAITPPGTYQLNYSICLSETTICSYASINVTVQNSIDAVNDTVTFNTQGVLCCGNSTLTLESFENTTGPNILPSNDWNLVTGLWKVFDNGIGTNQRWGINNTVSTPPIVYAGTNAAYVNRENNGIGNTSEDYLVTPLVTIPTNGKLRFFSRSFTSGNQGTIYQIRFAPSSANPTDPSSYSTILKQFTEDQLTFDEASNTQNPFNVYTEQVVGLPSGASGYIAFVKVFNQITDVIAGDRWLLDNVRILPGDAICDYNVLKNDSVSNCGIIGVNSEHNLYHLVSTNAVSLSLIGINPPTSNITLNALTGDINVSPNTPTNTYVITYKICTTGNMCDTATAVVNVVGSCMSTGKESGIVNKYLDKIAIYPNPSKGIFNIHFENEFAEKTNITVYNIIGQKIIEDQNINIKGYQIDLSNHPSGSYLVKIDSDGQLVTKKITKE